MGRTSDRLRCEPMVHKHRVRSMVSNPGAEWKLPCAHVHACLRPGQHSTGPQTQRSPGQSTNLLTCQSADMLCSGVTSMSSESNLSPDFAWPMSVHFDVPL